MLFEVRSVFRFVVVKYGVQDKNDKEGQRHRKRLNEAPRDKFLEYFIVLRKANAK